MLLTLSMRNVALVEELKLDFADGLHVMSGETGAGKSIVVDAVNLVLGGRADRELIRTGTDKAAVEAVFEAAEGSPVLTYLAEKEISCDGLVTLYRELTRSGRNLCRVCGVVVPVTVLKETGAFLMDIHGQHEHQFLMDDRFHLKCLDDSGDEAHQQLLSDTAEACRAFLACHRRYAALVRENAQKTYQMEHLKRAVEELSKARLKAGEEAALTRERDAGRHWEKISKALTEARNGIAEGEANALELIRPAQAALAGISGIDGVYEKMAGRLESAIYELEEIAYELAGLQDKQEYQPERAEQIENRLDRIHRVTRKYGGSEEEALKELERMQEELARYESMDAEVEKLGAEDRRLLAAYRKLARQLTEERTSLARRFEERMTGQLKDLGMEKTVFTVVFAPKPEGKNPMPQATGDDSVSFWISPNPGEPLKPLSKIASGGELSRLMLALKSLEAERTGVDCMVFDEIDTGISGRMAQVVAEKMATIARRRQVICVTHLPQIAAMAAHQLLVEKHVEGDRTQTTVRLLTEEERVGEVARMLGGADGSGESARSHAAHMLRTAEQFRGTRRPDGGT